MTQRQSWVYQQMGFLKTHIRCKGANRSSGFEASPNTSRHEESCGSTTATEHLESSVLRESRSQPTLTPTPVSTDSKILELFDQMRTLISGLLPVTTQQASSSTQAAVPAVTSTTHPAPLALETLHQCSQYRTRAADKT